MRVFVPAAILGLLAACSSSGGDGGGPGSTGPAVVGAAFVGAGATPAPGDFLILYMSKDVVLTGAILNDEDVTLSAGSLGAVGAAPTRIDSRAVRIVLGAGVNLAPGSTTIGFSDLNDAVQDNNGLLGAAGSSGTITMGDGDVPIVSALTLEAIQPALNGTGTAGGTLQVGPNGFDIDIEYSDPTSPITPTATEISADVNVATSAGTFVAGESFASQLIRTDGTGSSSFAVPSSVQLPTGSITLTVVVSDASGMRSAPRSFDLMVTVADDAKRPFESGQLWYLDLSRDLESYTFVPPGRVSRADISVTAMPNGTGDLEDLFSIIGLYGSDGAVNATVFDRVKSETLAVLNALYSDTSVTFTFNSPGSFPNGSTTVPYSSLGFSQICIAGAFNAQGTGGVLGLAIFDPNNETQDNDCEEDFQSMRLGVFLHTLVRAGVMSSSLSTFRSTFDPLTAGFMGTPIGDDGQDAARLAGSLSDPRASTIDTAIDAMARSIAIITAHECGHSVGLVQDGAMPAGLYGNDPINFPGSTSGHIDNSALFSGRSQNVMSPGISFDGAIDPDTGFNRLNRAYLRERALYDN